MLPVFLDLTGKKIVVFGGGEVGFRKASYFAEEADVTVVSQSFCDRFQCSSIRTIKEDVETVLMEMIGGADIVVAATDSVELNEKIARECSVQGKWCNCATRASDLIIPSVIRRDGYTVAISTLGRSPAMSRFIKQDLEGRLAPENSAMIDLQDQLRTAAKGVIPDQSERERFLWEVLGDKEVWECLRTGNTEQAMSLAERRMVMRD